MSRKDYLVHVPIKDSRPDWSNISGHHYDYMLAVDDMGKLWFFSYSVADLNHADFKTFLDWLTTGRKPAEVNEAVQNHYDSYKSLIAYGLACKCAGYDTYCEAMWETARHRAMKGAAKGTITNEQLNELLKLMKDTFDKIRNKDNYSPEEQESFVDTLASAIIFPMQPFTMIGVYHWDGDMNFERKDYVAGQNLTGVRIPKSAAQLDDEKLSCMDFDGDFDDPDDDDE